MYMCVRVCVCVCACVCMGWMGYTQKDIWDNAIDNVVSLAKVMEDDYQHQIKESLGARSHILSHFP